MCTYSSLLKKDYPTLSLAQHIYGATADYGEIWGMTDKEFLYAINKYSSELEFDVKETGIDQIIANASNENLFKLDEEEDYGND